MPDRTSWPPPWRYALTIVYVMAYTHIMAAGIDVAVGALGGVGVQIGHLSTDVIGLLAAGWSAMAMIGQLLERWRWEFYSIGALVGSLLAYNTVDWLVVLVVHPNAPIRGASVTSAVLWLLLARFISLWVFNRRAVQVRQAVVAL